MPKQPHFSENKATSSEKNATILERLLIFIEWRRAPRYWYTLDEIAKNIKVHRPSLAPTFSTLRRAGYVVSLKWVYTKQQYLYRIEEQNLKSLEKRVAKAKR